MRQIRHLFFILIFFTMQSAIAKESFSLRGDAWCPFNCDPKKDGKRGYMVDIADKIFTDHGVVVDYQILNWSRTKKEVAAGRINAAVGASKSDGDFVYPTMSFGMFSNKFYVLKGNTWRYKDEQSLKGVKVGVINDYTYGENADRVIAQKNLSIVKISGDDALPSLIKMLTLKRLTALYENPFVFQHKLRVLGLNPADFEEAGSFDAGEEPLYIAFSPKFPKAQELVKILDAGIVQLRKTGELKKILSSYGLSDWQK